MSHLKIHSLTPDLLWLTLPRNLGPTSRIGDCRMSSKRILLVFAFAMFTGSLAGNITATPKKKLCIPCTPYCKTHPNAPRCN